MENQLPEQQEHQQVKVMIGSLSEVERVAFYKKTYSHVAGGVLVFILFEYLLMQSDTIIEFMFSMTREHGNAYNR